MPIRIRVDDYPWNKATERWRHNAESFRSFHRALSELIGGRRYLLGVIPKKCSPEDLLLLRNETNCVVGMHGIDHDEERLNAYQNEFEPWMSGITIEKYLREAKVALEGAVGQQINIYMPPRNQIDVRTVEACRDAGFRWYTSGPETTLPIRVAAGMKVPSVGPIHSQPPHEYGRTDEMLMAGSHEILARATRRIVLTLHWTWEVNLNDGFQSMREFFGRIPKEQFEDFDL